MESPSKRSIITYFVRVHMREGSIITYFARVHMREGSMITFLRKKKGGGEGEGASSGVGDG